MEKVKVGWFRRLVLGANILKFLDEVADSIDRINADIDALKAELNEDRRKLEELAERVDGLQSRIDECIKSTTAVDEPVK